MARITQAEIVELATAEVSSGEERIERVYRWHFEQALALVRALFVVAGTLIGASLTAIIQRAGPLATWQALIAAAAFAGAAGAAVYQYARLGRLYGNYVFAVVQRVRETERWIHTRSS
jgi:hypothetical protein